jgi:hypothetical protein
VPWENGELYRIPDNCLLASLFENGQGQANGKWDPNQTRLKLLSNSTSYVRNEESLILFLIITLERGGEVQWYGGQGSY